MLALLMLTFNACKKNTVDVTDLLKTVPSSAAGVMVINVESLLDESGCKVKDHEITPSDYVEALLGKATSRFGKDIMMLFRPGTGIEPKGAVCFYDSSRAFLTVALYDNQKFQTFVEGWKGGKFEDAGSGVSLLGNVAVKGDQAWILMSENRRIDTDAISSYYSLASAQSFLVTPMGEELLTSEDDVRGWALIDTFVNEFLDRSNRSWATIGLGFLFEKAESLKFNAEFDKGEFEFEAMPLDAKFKPAKYKLVSDKVDVEQLKALGGTCDAMMAFTLTPKLAKKINEVSKTFGGAFLGDVEKTLKNVDGTVGLISSGEIGQPVNLTGSLKTKGELSSDLKGFISEYVGTLTIDGDIVKIQKGEVKGALDVAQISEDLKGSCVGLVADQKEIETLWGVNISGYKYLVFKMQPESGSIEFKVNLYTSDPEGNSLLPMLKGL